VPRNRLILRQLSLSLAALFTCLAAWGTAAVLAGSGSTTLLVVAVLPMLAGLVAPVLVWFAGEDRLDRGAGWYTAIGVVTLLFAAAAGSGVPATYLNLAGQRVPVVVTAADKASADGYQRVAVSAAASGEDLGEVLLFAEHHLRAGDRMVTVVDPLGWFPPGAGQPPPMVLRSAYGLAAAGVVLLAASTALRIRRDLHRYDFTGSRRPPQRRRRVDRR
jgi:hypothetical protein